MNPLAPPHIMQLEAYLPGKTIRETQAEYGVSNLVKLASNESAWGPSPLTIEAARVACADAHLYPLEIRGDVKKQICEFHSEFEIEPKHVVLGNGSNELIVLLTRAFLGESESVMIGWPSFIVYRQAAQAQGCRVVSIPLTSDYHYDLSSMTQRVKLAFIANPNNPTGTFTPSTELNSWISSLSEETIVVIDEAYAEYVTDHNYTSCMPWILKRPRTVVLKTFSKIFGMAGMRIGYAVADPEIGRILHRIRDPFNVNHIAQAAAIAALKDHEHRIYVRDGNAAELPRLRAELEKLGIRTTPSVANFVLMHLRDDQPSVEQVVRGLLRRGIIVRPVQNYDLPRSIRVTIGKPDENDRFLQSMVIFVSKTPKLK